MLRGVVDSSRALRQQHAGEEEGGMEMTQHAQKH
eukprot:gene38091-43696_t